MAHIQEENEIGYVQNEVYSLMIPQFMVYANDWNCLRRDLEPVLSVILLGAIEIKHYF